MRALPAVAVLLLVSACQAPPSQMTDAEKAQIEAEVSEWAEGFLAAFGELNPDRLMRLWVGENISSVSGGLRLTSAAELDGFYQNLVAGWASVEMEWLPGAVVDVLSPDIALFQGTARQVAVDPEGVRGVGDVHFTNLLKKVEGAWKIQRNHVSWIVVSGE